MGIVLSRTLGPLRAGETIAADTGASRHLPGVGDQGRAAARRGVLGRGEDARLSRRRRLLPRGAGRWRHRRRRQLSLAGDARQDDRQL